VMWKVHVGFSCKKAKKTPTPVHEAKLGKGKKLSGEVRKTKTIGGKEGIDLSGKKTKKNKRVRRKRGKDRKGGGRWG